MKPRKKKYFPVFWIDVDAYASKIRMDDIRWNQYQGTMYNDNPIRDYVKEFTFEINGEGLFYYPLVF